MSEVDRFRSTAILSEGVIEHPSGEWVRWVDYAALRARVAELEDALRPLALVRQTGIIKDSHINEARRLLGLEE